MDSGGEERCGRTEASGVRTSHRAAPLPFWVCNGGFFFFLSSELVSSSTQSVLQMFSPGVCLWLAFSPQAFSSLGLKEMRVSHKEATLFLCPLWLETPGFEDW